MSGAANTTSPRTDPLVLQQQDGRQKSVAMADCDCMADADREWLLDNLPDATEDEQDWFVLKVAFNCCDMDLTTDESRDGALLMIKQGRN